MDFLVCVIAVCIALMGFAVLGYNHTATAYRTCLEYHTPDTCATILQ